MRNAKGITYTYVVKWEDKKHGETGFDYFYSDLHDISSMVDEHYEFEGGGEIKYEIWYIETNNFVNDEYLTFDITRALKGDTPVFENKNEDERKEEARWYAAYIKELYDRFRIDKEKREDYKKSILESVLKFLDLRRQNPMTIYVIDEIFNIFDIKRNTNLNVRKQIELILRPKDNDYILIKLAKVGSEKTLRLHLDKIGEAYRIHEEKSQYRIGVLFLKFYDTQRHLLSPSFIKPDSDKEIKNYSKYMKLMASYYGIDTPTYREGILRKHKEQGMKQPLISTIRNEHMQVWLSIQ